MKQSRLCLLAAIALTLTFLLVSTDTFAQQSFSLRGHIFDQASCAGLSHLTIKLTPSRKLHSQADLISITDEHGDFQLQAQELGDYYLAIFDGVTQIYGHVVSFRDENQLMIGLQPVAQSQRKSPVGCLTPIALALSSDQDLFVLDSHSGILRYSLADPSSFSQVIAQFSSSWQPMDLAVSKDSRADHLFVTLQQGNSGQLMRYSSKAQFEASWIQYSPLVGVCADETAGQVYVAIWDTGQVLQQGIDAPQGSPPQSVVRLLNVHGFGPLAIDKVGRILYAADSSAGKVHAVELKSKADYEVAQNVGQPSAMDFDPTTKRLLIADRAGAQIWALPGYPAKGKPTVFLRFNMFRTPSAVVVGPDGRVWVGDQSAHAIFEFAPDRCLLRTIK